VAEEGSHEELLAARGAYWALVRQQMGPVDATMDRSSRPQPGEPEVQHLSGTSLALPHREAPLTRIVDVPVAIPPAPRPDVHESRAPSQRVEEVPHKDDAEGWARVGTWCRALRRNRPESGWAVGGVLGAALSGAVRSVRSMRQPVCVHPATVRLLSSFSLCSHSRKTSTPLGFFKVPIAPLNIAGLCRCTLCWRSCWLS